MSATSAVSGTGRLPVGARPVQVAKPRHRSWLIGAALGLALAAALPGAELLDLKYLGAAMEHYGARPQQLSARIEVETRLPEQEVAEATRGGGRVVGEVGREKGIVTTRMTARYYRWGERVRIVNEQILASDATRAPYAEREELILDGQTAYMLSVYRENVPEAEPTRYKRRFSAQVAAASEAAPYGIWPGARWAEPRLVSYYAVYLRKPEPLARLLLGAPDLLADLGEEADGELGLTLRRIVYRQNPEMHHHWWLDPAHGMMIRRSQLVSTTGDFPGVDCETIVKEVLEIDGGFLPLLTRTTAVIIRPTADSTPAAPKYGPIGRMERTIRLLDVVTGGPPTPELFEPNWPPGTVVNDHTKQERRFIESLTSAEQQAVWRLRVEGGGERR